MTFLTSLTYFWIIILALAGVTLFLAFVTRNTQGNRRRLPSVWEGIWIIILVFVVVLIFFFVSK